MKDRFCSSQKFQLLRSFGLAKPWRNVLNATKTTFGVMFTPKSSAIVVYLIIDKLVALTN